MPQLHPDPFRDADSSRAGGCLDPPRWQQGQHKEMQQLQPVHIYIHPGQQRLPEMDTTSQPEELCLVRGEIWYVWGEIGAALCSGLSSLGFCVDVGGRRRVVARVPCVGWGSAAVSVMNYQ